MANRITGLLGAAVLAAALNTAPAMAQETFSEWDADGDGVVSLEEFEQGWTETGLFSEWDTDGDGVLSEEEYAEGVFNAYDEDDDAGLDDAEFGELEDEDFWDLVILCPEEQAESEPR